MRSTQKNFIKYFGLRSIYYKSILIINLYLKKKNNLETLLNK